MSNGYDRVAFTRHVLDAQARYGSRAAQARLERPGARRAARRANHIRTRLHRSARRFYLATISSDTGWPYVQFRGGPAGFVRTPTEHSLTWADFRGNRQYISTDNIAHNDRVALFLMDYPNQLRLKVYGRADLNDVRDQPGAADALTVPGYPAIIERVMTVTVAAYDWNCPQHITPRYTRTELRELAGRPPGPLSAVTGQGACGLPGAEP